ncbi:MAG: hypothetical protein JWN71_2401 [Xanthobacteraceae bacterium]|jgi:hypothetical protein|nr:hypothetical protein [Xanthobacteraceae bacterium]
MFKTIAAIAAAALIAAAIAMMPGFAPQADASTPTGVKGDRLDIRVAGPTCSQKAWPYIEAGCLRDTSKNAGRAKTVRLVTADRLN